MIRGKRVDFYAYFNGLTNEIDLTPYVNFEVEKGKLYYIPALRTTYQITKVA